MSGTDLFFVALLILGGYWLFHSAFTPPKNGNHFAGSSNMPTPAAPAFRPPNPADVDKARAVFASLHGRQPDPSNPLDAATMQGITATLPGASTREEGPVILDKAAASRAVPVFRAIHGREPSTRADWATVERLIEAIPAPSTTRAMEPRPAAPVQPQVVYVPVQAGAGPWTTITPSDLARPVNGNPSFRPVPAGGVQYQGHQG